MLSGSLASNSSGLASAANPPPRFSVIRVRAAGAMALTVMPYRPSSMAAMTVREAMPAFAAP